MTEEESRERTLRRFKKKDLTRILRHKGIKLEGKTREQLIRHIVSKDHELSGLIHNCYEKLRGAGLNGIIQEVSFIDPVLAENLSDCRTRGDLLTSLVVADKTDVVDQVSDYLRYARKRGLSPILFDGKTVPRVLIDPQKAVMRIIAQMDKGRLRHIVLDDVSLSEAKDVLRIAISRESGRKHVRQLPERAIRPDLQEHDDYPLRPHVLEINFSRKLATTTFGRNDRDGMLIVESMLSGVVKLKGRPTEMRFLSNILDSSSNSRIKKSIEALLANQENGGQVHTTLIALESGKVVSITVKGLDVVGDMQKLEVQADDVEKTMQTLGIDKHLLETARDVSHEIELSDKRRISVQKLSLVFTGEFTKAERDAIEEVYRE